jgi:hypothetical protein
MATRMTETPNRATSTIEIRIITLVMVARGLQAAKAGVRRLAAFRVRDMWWLCIDGRRSGQSPLCIFSIDAVHTRDVPIPPAS